MSINKEARLIQTLQKILDKRSKVRIEGNTITIGDSSIEIPQNLKNTLTNAKQTDVSI